jgi:hypothetical protein
MQNMQTWRYLTFFLLLVLAGVTGCTLARTGVARGEVAWVAGAFNLRLGSRRIIMDTLQIRPGLVYYRIIILPI